MKTANGEALLRMLRALPAREADRRGCCATCGGSLTRTPARDVSVWWICTGTGAARRTEHVALTHRGDCGMRWEARHGNRLEAEADGMLCDHHLDVLIARGLLALAAEYGFTAEARAVVDHLLAARLGTT